MVNYKCQICNKEFNKKSNFIYHTKNRKNACGENQTIQKNYPELPQNTQELPQNKPKNTCEYCNKDFSRKEHLQRHLLNNCKIKKEDDINKKNIFELLLEKERAEKELLTNQLQLEKEKAEKEFLNNKLNVIENDNKELKKQLLDLTKTIKELSVKSATVINNNNYGNVNNNITIPLDKLSKFGKEDLTKITQKEFLKIKNYQGVAIFLETAKLIYNNHSMNKTVYVADYSRKKAMIWNGERWVLTCLEEVLDVMKERIRTLYNINLDLIEDEKIIKDFNNRVQKYFDMLYDEYDEERKEDKKFIERVNSLQEKYGNDLMFWLTNIKKDVIDNFNKISSEVTNNKLLFIDNGEDEVYNNYHLIDDIQPIKKRGRPKKIL